MAMEDARPPPASMLLFSTDVSLAGVEEDARQRKQSSQPRKTKIRAGPVLAQRRSHLTC